VPRPLVPPLTRKPEELLNRGPAAVPVPNPQLPFQRQDPIILLACCVWGESRGEIAAAKIAVACCVRNRVRRAPRFGTGWVGVLLAPWQFSSFDPQDPNRPKLLEPLEHDSVAVWQESYTVAYVVYNGSQPDVTSNACFYYGPPLAKPPAAWGSVVPCGQFGSLHFFRDVSEVEVQKLLAAH
jgi:cell wall hydrolase